MSVRLSIYWDPLKNNNNTELTRRVISNKRDICLTQLNWIILHFPASSCRRIDDEFTLAYYEFTLYISDEKITRCRVTIPTIILTFKSVVVCGLKIKNSIWGISTFLPQNGMIRFRIGTRLARTSPLFFICKPHRQHIFFRSTPHNKNKETTSKSSYCCGDINRVVLVMVENKQECD